MHLPPVFANNFKSHIPAEGLVPKKCAWTGNECAPGPQLFIGEGDTSSQVVVNRPALYWQRHAHLLEEAGIVANHPPDAVTRRAVHPSLIGGPLEADREPHLLRLDCVGFEHRRNVFRKSAAGKVGGIIEDPNVRPRVACDHGQNLFGEASFRNILHFDLDVRILIHERGRHIDIGRLPVENVRVPP